MHADLPKIALICRKLNLEHVPAVIGFEKGGNGKSHPVLSGVVTFSHNIPLIENEHAKMTSKHKIRHREKIQKQARQVWRQLIKAILVKKYVQEVYDRGG